MRPTPNPKVERYRITYGPMPSSARNGNNGWFRIPSPGTRCLLNVIVSDGLGWDHVSVTVHGVDRCPTWSEMDFVKRLFWDDEEIVMQLHPPRSLWVNNHRFCLHLWRPQAAAIPIPPPLMVGVPGLEIRV